MRPLDQPVTMSDMVNFQKKITCQNKRIWTQRKGRELRCPQQDPPMHTLLGPNSHYFYIDFFRKVTM